MTENTVHSGVSSETMRQDIADTEAEIIVMQREMEGFRLVGDRWSMKARETGIMKRREFIEKLRSFLRQRGEL